MPRTSPPDRHEFPSWTLFAMAAAIVVPLSAGFVLGGPMIGLAAGLLAVLVVVVLAIRQDTVKSGRPGSSGADRHPS